LFFGLVSTQKSDELLMMKKKASSFSLDPFFFSSITRDEKILRGENKKKILRKKSLKKAIRLLLYRVRKRIHTGERDFKRPPPRARRRRRPHAKKKCERETFIRV